MSEDVQTTGSFDQELSVLENRERKIKAKWVSFKKRLRTDRRLDPGDALRKYAEAEAKYEAALALIDWQREQIAVRSL